MRQKDILEALTTAYKNVENLDIRIARIFNTYGPRMRKNDGRAIPNFINQALNKENLLFMVMEVKQDLFAI